MPPTAFRAYTQPVLVFALVTASLAALVHLYIFVLESLRWEHPATMRIFGTTAQSAAATKDLAFNQGFYNLFLAVIVIVGALLAPAQPGVGLALVLAATGSMLAAALVLVTSDPSKARAALVQGLLPASAVGASVIHLVA